jgi:hypothetical protein
MLQVKKILLPVILTITGNVVFSQKIIPGERMTAAKKADVVMRELPLPNQDYIPPAKQKRVPTRKKTNHRRRTEKTCFACTNHYYFKKFLLTKKYYTGDKCAANL